MNLLKYKKEMAAIVIAATVSYCTLNYRVIRPNALAIMKDGKTIGYVGSTADYREAKYNLENYIQDTYKTYDLADEFQLKKVKVSEDMILTKTEAEKVLLQSSDVKVEAAALVIDGKEIAIVENEKEGNKIIQGVSEYYTEKSGLKDIKEIKVLSQITYNKIMHPLSEIREDNLVIKDIIKGNNNNDIIKISFRGTKTNTVKISPSTRTIWTNDYVIGTVVTKQNGKAGLNEVDKLINMENEAVKSSNTSETRVINKSIDKIVAVGTKNPILAGIAFLTKPSRGGISSYFGYRWGKLHKGLDIGASIGTPIYAAADGTVESASWDSGGYGNLVKLSHGSGIETLYGHTSRMVVKAGQKIKRGQLIAYVGSTGHSTGPHVHFEVRLNGTAVNPLKYLK
ncbi:MAG: peptidoglycan DD-metalloendopeptidase family protein [Bacillota bacterium]|nr:peptidoglycan DD-metalloendopeptidase family protein [Bacillota bacterium]